MPSCFPLFLLASFADGYLHVHVYYVGVLYIVLAENGKDV